MKASVAGLSTAAGRDWSTCTVVVVPLSVTMDGDDGTVTLYWDDYVSVSGLWFRTIIAVVVGHSCHSSVSSLGGRHHYQV